MKNYHDRSTVDDIIERVETIFHRGSESQRKDLLRGLGKEFRRLTNDQYCFFLDSMIGDVEIDSIDEAEVPVGSEFDERDDDNSDRYMGQFLD